MRSAVALAGLVASAMAAESSSCPLTTIITSTVASPTRVYVTVTSLDVDPLPTVTETPTDWVTTGTTTRSEPVYVETCTSTTRYVRRNTTHSYGSIKQLTLHTATSSTHRPSTPATTPPLPSVHRLPAPQPARSSTYGPAPQPKLTRSTCTPQRPPPPPSHCQPKRPNGPPTAREPRPSTATAPRPSSPPPQPPAPPPPKPSNAPQQTSSAPTA
jgi:hypothetical protein